MVVHIRREAKILQFRTALRAEETSVVGWLHLHSGFSQVEYAKDVIDVQHPGICAAFDTATNGTWVLLCPSVELAICGEPESASANPPEDGSRCADWRCSRSGNRE